MRPGPAATSTADWSTAPNVGRSAVTVVVRSAL